MELVGLEPTTSCMPCISEEAPDEPKGTENTGDSEEPDHKPD